MKKPICLLYLLLILLVFSACQPTPQQEAVIGRQDDVLETMTAVPSEEFKKIETPDHVSDAYDFEKLSVTFDADIVVPHATAYPVTNGAMRMSIATNSIR